MDILDAIRKVTGVSLADMQSSLKSKDRIYARAIYSKMSRLSRGDLARQMNKSYNAVTYYWRIYETLYASNSEFKEWADEIEKMI